MVSDIGGQIADPLSRKNIREMTDGLRELFGLENELNLPIVKVIEFLSNNGMLNLEICTIDEMGTKLEGTIPLEDLIKL